MSDTDFNPLVFKEILETEDDEFHTIASGVLDTSNLQRKEDIQQHYQHLLAHYQRLQAQHEQLHDKALALADVMYQMLAFINAQRLYQNQDAIMANDIANTIEKNVVLTEITTQLREAAIESKLGLIAQFDETQEYLRTHVMQTWKQHFTSEEERNPLGKKLFPAMQTPKTTDSSTPDEIF